MAEPLVDPEREAPEAGSRGASIIGCNAANGTYTTDFDLPYTRVM